ncbi:MAG: hypothetical protein AAGA66_02345 [Bacteroidota bacterium]
MPGISYDIAIGTKTYQTPGAAGLKSLNTYSTLTTPVNSAIIELTGMETTGTGDEVKVKLGSEGKTTLVFTGVVRSVTYSLESTTVYATSASEPLTRYQVAVAYENQAAGAIVKDLADQLGLSVGKAAEGVQFPRYTLTAKQAAWHHIKTLGAYSGVDSWSDETDTLQFTPYVSKPSNPFTYGVDVLETEKEAVSVTLDGVVVFGESDGQEEESFWLKKATVKGTAGKTTGVVKSHAIYAARTEDLCKKIATNLLEAVTQRKSRGRTRVLNGEQVRLGATFSLKGAPENILNGNYKVVSVRHELNPEEGYTTEINWEEYT